MVVALPTAGDFPAGKPAIKLLCRYGGRILPRQPDGRLRYVGGETRLVSLPRSAPFSGPPSTPKAPVFYFFLSPFWC